MKQPIVTQICAVCAKLLNTCNHFGAAVQLMTEVEGHTMIIDGCFAYVSSTYTALLDLTDRDVTAAYASAVGIDKERVVVKDVETPMWGKAYRLRKYSFEVA